MHTLSDLIDSPELFARGLRAIAIALAFWLVSHLLALLVRVIAKRVGAEPGPGSLVSLSLGPLRALVVVLGLYYATTELALGGRLERFSEGVFYVCAMVVAVFAVLRLAALAASAYLLHLGDGARVRLEREYVPLVRKAAAVLISMVGLIITLSHFGIEVTALITTLGVGGLAVGLAAKETLSNMIAGFTILVDRPFRQGDRVKLATGEIGDVQGIGIRSTKIRLLDHNLLVVPNAELTNTRIVNCSQPSIIGQGTVDIRVAFGTEVDRVEAILLGAAQAESAVAPEPAPKVELKRFVDGSIELQLSFVAVSHEVLPKAEDRVRRGVHRALAEAKIPVAPGRLEVRLLDQLQR